MAKTLRDFWNKADGVYDFVDKNGVSIDDMNYPLETEVLNERLIEGEQYEITLNVEVKEWWSMQIVKESIIKKHSYENGEAYLLYRADRTIPLWFRRGA